VELRRKARVGAIGDRFSLLLSPDGEKMIKAIVTVLLTVFSSVLYLGAEYKGEKNYAQKVYNNCMRSGISGDICSNYVRIIGENRLNPMITSYTPYKKFAPPPLPRLPEEDAEFFRDGI
jgi:hypothetical protein